MKEKKISKLSPVDCVNIFPVEFPKHFNFGYEVSGRRAKIDRAQTAMMVDKQRHEELRNAFYDARRLFRPAAGILLKCGFAAATVCFALMLFTWR